MKCQSVNDTILNNTLVLTFNMMTFTYTFSISIIIANCIIFLLCYNMKIHKHISTEFNEDEPIFY